MFKRLGDIFEDQKDFRQQKKYTIKKDQLDVFDFFHIVRNWKNIVGEGLAKNTVPLKNHNKVLTILTNHPVYAQQLSFMEKDLINKIISNYPKMKNQFSRIKFQSSTTYFDEKRKDLLKAAQNFDKNKPEEKVSLANPKLHPQNPEYKKIKEKFEKEYSYVEDETLRNKLISISLQRHFRE